MRTVCATSSGNVLPISIVGITTNVNALGEKTITFSDPLGRTTRTEIRSASNVLVRESTFAYSADHHSVTVTNGSGSSAIASTTFTDADGRNLLSVAYPSSNVKEFTFRDYDAAGNMVYEERDSSSNGAISGWSGAKHRWM